MQVKNIIFSILFLSINALSISSFASGKNPPSSGGYGGLRCAAYDAGKDEEHGPHSSCSSCLSKHGNCEERCFTYTFSCRSEGYRINYNGREELITSYGDGYSEMDARHRAEEKCYYDRLSRCRVVSCNETAHEDSSRSCR